MKKFNTIAAKSHSELVALHKMGFTEPELAERFNVSEYSIRRILAEKYIISTCPSCGKKFLATHGGKFCSSRCTGKAYRNASHKVKRTHPWSMKETVIPHVIAGKDTKEIMTITGACRSSVIRWQKYYASHPEEFSDTNVSALVRKIDTPLAKYNHPRCSPHKEKIIELYLAGKSKKEIRDELGVSRLTVIRWIDRYNMNAPATSAAAPIEASKPAEPVAEISVPAKKKSSRKVKRFTAAKTYRKKTAPVAASRPEIPVTVAGKLPPYVAVVLWPVDKLSDLPSYIGKIA